VVEQVWVEELEIAAAVRVVPQLQEMLELQVE
jgi:hypothetical protein